MRGLLPEAEVASITEQLSGSCTTEIASFNEFTELLTDSGGQIGGFDHVLFDTAPTGHTIRLLQLPGSWTDFLNEGKGDASCLGPLAGLEKQRTVYAEAVAALADPERTRVVLVARAQKSTLAEIARTHRELAAIGLTRPVRRHQRGPARPDRRQLIRSPRRSTGASSRRSRPCPTNCVRCRSIRSNSSPPTSSG